MQVNKLRNAEIQLEAIGYIYLGAYHMPLQIIGVRQRAEGARDYVYSLVSLCVQVRAVCEW